MNSAANKTFILTKTTRDGVSLCQFGVYADGTVRVQAYATWTSYFSDFTVTAEEAREVWRQKKAEGFVLDPYYQQPTRVAA